MKLLLISHNPFSTYQSMGKTFASLFAAFPREQLCQLYIYPSFPDVDAVGSCYRFTDRDAVKRVFPFTKAGGVVSPRAYNGSMLQNETDKKFYSKSSNSQPVKRLLRDLLWNLSHWYTKDLQRWLDREKPDCIFLAPGYARFIYDIALTISRKRNIPLITYICDDNYFLATPETVAGRLWLRLLQKKTRQVMEHSRLVVAISQEIAQQYRAEFSVKSEVIMTGASIGVAETLPQRKEIKSFSYFGNLDLNREKSLAEMGRVLDEINAGCGTELSLNIHTGNETPAEFAEIKSIRMGGFLVGDAFRNAFRSADCLVHAEAFDEKNRDIVKGSVSTKIADSLASGIPLLAYGPGGIASIEHLRRNDCAFVAGSVEELKTVISRLLEDGEERSRISANAKAAAERYHVSSSNSEKLYAIVKEIVEGV